MNNTLIFLYINLLVLFLIICGAIFLIIKYARLVVNHNRLMKFLYNYLNVITSARYGNFNLKCPDGVDALTIQISRNTNALIESVRDRDSMIKEYIEKDRQTQNLKQDFVSGLAHDLKVPIIAQDNTYDLFLNGNFGDLTDVQKDVIKNLKISNNDLRNLILNMLDAQKLDRNELLPEKKNTDIIQLINEILEQNKNILTFQNKTINFVHIESELSCLIDPFLIKRAINNLISNAIFCAKNSKKIEIILENFSDTIKISIKDEGNGINEEDINNIFKKYYSSRKKYSSIASGLGLYIVNKIVEAHNGKISAKNNPVKGACFSILLPVK